MTYRSREWMAAVASLECCVLCGRYGVQVAHSNQDRGMGQKAPDCATAALCPECHHAIDNGKDLSRDERRAMMDRAIVLTMIALVVAGKVAVAKDRQSCGEFDNWKPTPKEINRLPLPIRNFIHLLETHADPAGTIRENVLARDEIACLRKMVIELEELATKRG